MIKGIADDVLNRAYNFSEMTNEELRCKFFQKLEECIDLCNNTSDIIEWIKNEEVENKVNQLLTLWLDDGTLEELINNNLVNIMKEELSEEINENNDKIEALNKQINIIKSDIEKIKIEIAPLKVSEG